MNLLVDFVEQIKTARWYTEHRFRKRAEEGDDVESLLVTEIPGDGESPLQIATHAVSALHKFVRGVEDPDLDLTKLEVPVDKSLKPSEQIHSLYQLAVDDMSKLGDRFSSLDDSLVNPYNKKETTLREMARFFAFHLIEHSGQVIRFQHHLASCVTHQER